MFFPLSQCDIHGRNHHIHLMFCSLMIRTSKSMVLGNGIEIQCQYHMTKERSQTTTAWLNVQVPRAAPQLLVRLTVSRCVGLFQTYINVISRPMVIDRANHTIWTSVYVDAAVRSQSPSSFPSCTQLLLYVFMYILGCFWIISFDFQNFYSSIYSFLFTNQLFTSIFFNNKERCCFQCFKSILV